MKDYSIKDDYYCYEGTFILKNKFNIKDKKLLDSVEKDITGSMIFLLQSFNFDDRELDDNFLMWLHKYIFEDIYDWAGKLRVVDLTKDEFKFAHYLFLKNNLNKYFMELKNDNYLIDYKKDLLIDKLSYYITELNVLHPFREGNGRVIREYFRILLERKNLYIDYSDKEAYLEAMIESPRKTEKLKMYLIKNLKTIDFR